MFRQTPVSILVVPFMLAVFILIMASCTATSDGIAGVGTITNGYVRDYVLSIDPHADGYTSVWLKEDEETTVYCLSPQQRTALEEITFAFSSVPALEVVINFKSVNVGGEGWGFVGSYCSEGATLKYIIKDVILPADLSAENILTSILDR